MINNNTNTNNNVNNINTADRNNQDNNCMNVRQEMLMKIRELSFAITELALYLNTHSDDEKAICLHKEYAKRLHDLIDKYQKVYGPLTYLCPCNKWRWLEEPWPWERGDN